MKSILLIAFLIVNSIRLFGQSTQKSDFIRINSFQARAILKNSAELEMRREQAMIDSTAYQAMFRAYLYKDSAYQAMTQAQQATHESAQAYAELYHNSDKSLATAKKEIRRQKRLKIITMIGAGVVLLLSLH